MVDVYQPMTDREMLAAAQEQQALELAALQHVQHYRALGTGLAAFVLAMWDALDGEGFTREEQWGLVQAAVRGR